MSKYITINIPEGCTQDWNMMEQRNEGKHCNSCQKTVIDFTLMTDTQLANFFKKNTSNVCGRFYDDQLDRQITIPKRELPLLKYFFTITLPAFLFSQKSLGQNNFKKQKTVLVKQQIKAKEIVCYVEKIPKEIKDSVVNLEEIFVTSGINQGRVKHVTGVIATSYSKSVSIISPSKIKPIVNENLNVINIFPNPISQNSKLNISWKDNISSNQFVEIFNANGSLIQKEMVVVSSKTQNAFVWLKQMQVGFYIIKITDTKTRLQLSKEFIVN
jgi:Secretion system C-terminal sorting domain